MRFELMRFAPGEICLGHSARRGSCASLPLPSALPTPYYRTATPPRCCQVAQSHSLTPREYPHPAPSTPTQSTLSTGISRYAFPRSIRYHVLPTGRQILTLALASLSPSIARYSTRISTTQPSGGLTLKRTLASTLQPRAQTSSACARSPQAKCPYSRMRSLNFFHSQNALTPTPLEGPFRKLC